VSRRPRDLNQLAAQLVREATDPDAAPETAPETPAQVNGRQGGLKGGQVRAERLSPERRSEIARNAARARWHEK
jgi:hypothetical protein